MLTTLYSQEPRKKLNRWAKKDNYKQQGRLFQMKYTSKFSIFLLSLLTVGIVDIVYKQMAI